MSIKELKNNIILTKSSSNSLIFSQQIVTIIGGNIFPKNNNPELFIEQYNLTLKKSQQEIHQNKEKIFGKFNYLNNCSFVKFSKTKILILGGKNDKKQSLNSCFLYDFINEKWEFLNDFQLSEPKSRFYCEFILEKYLLVCGGFNSQNKWINTLEIYDFAKNSLIKTINLTSLRQDFAFIFNKNVLYIIGGYENNKQALRLTEKIYFDEILNNNFYFEKCQDLNVERYGHSASVINNSLFVFGGCNSKNCLNSVEKFENNKWSLCSFMNYSRAFASIFTSENNDVYIFGG